MTVDIEKLKALALAPMQATTAVKAEQALADFRDEANPAAVLELLEKIEQLQSEVERLRAELATRCRVEGDTILDGLPKFEWWLMSRDDAEYYKVDDVRERLRAAPAAGTVEKDAGRRSPEIPDSSISAQAARDVLADAKGGFDHAAE